MCGGYFLTVKKILKNKKDIWSCKKQFESVIKTIHEYKNTYPSRRIFRTQSNIFDGAFLRKQLTVLFSQSAIADVRLGSKYAFAQVENSLINASGDFYYKLSFSLVTDSFTGYNSWTIFF